MSIKVDPRWCGCTCLQYLFGLSHQTSPHTCLQWLSLQEVRDKTVFYNKQISMLSDKLTFYIKCQQKVCLFQRTNISISVDSNTETCMLKKFWSCYIPKWMLVNAFRWTGVLYVMINKIFSSGFWFLFFYPSPGWRWTSWWQTVILASSPMPILTDIHGRVCLTRSHQLPVGRCVFTGHRSPQVHE